MNKFMMLTWSYNDFKKIAEKAVKELLYIGLDKGCVHLESNDSDKDFDELLEIIVSYIEKEYNVKAKIDKCTDSYCYYLFANDGDQSLPDNHDVFMLCELI